MTAPSSYLVGRGIADCTGEAAGVGMLGYGKAKQITEGIHMRLRSRAFVFADAATGRRLLLVVSDLPLMFDSVRKAVLARVRERFGARYGEQNTMLTVTHTHCGPGGYSHHYTYNSTTGGFRPATFAAIVDGIVEAVERADADVAPATLTLGRGELRDASANRSRRAFDRNPAADRAFFPDAIDPQTTTLRIDRDGRPVGAINWFATHNTSMTNENRLISSDNKGYAAYAWERLDEGGDYLTGALEFVAAFAQTNAGDMSPNLRLKPGHGPTDNQFENTRILGTRQYEAAATALAGADIAVAGGVDCRLTYITLSDVLVEPEFTGDGKSHRTSKAIAGAAAIAGAWSDGKGFAGFREGRNRFWDALSRHAIYRLSSKLKDSQAPKGLVFPAGWLNRFRPLAQERVPVQLLRVGRLYLIGIPGEVTITAGLRLRRAVAGVVGAAVEDVLVAGYSNGYIHYVTTPEEYDAQEYEGGSTMFGRWELPALVQAAFALATAMRDGIAVHPGPPAPDLAGRAKPTKRRIPTDVSPDGAHFGDVLSLLAASYQPGDIVAVTFAGAHPGNDVRRGGTFVEVQRAHDGEWRTIADDGDWDTKFRWRRTGRGTSTVTITWDIANGTAPGRYRIRYLGDARDDGGRVQPITGTSPPFEIDSRMGVSGTT